jgi:hypothetical protein
MTRKLLLTIGLAALGVGMAAPSASAALPTRTIECGEVIERSLRVANSVFGCDVHGLVIEKPGITVDLGGNFIAGNNTDDVVGTLESGIRCASECDGVTIRNGSVRRFEAGAFVGAAERGVTLKGLHASESVQGFSLNGPKALVQGSTATDSTDNGFSMNGSRAILAGNEAFGGGTGFSVQGDENVLRSNRARGSGDDGFLLTSAAESTRLSGNLAAGSVSDGYETDGTRTVLTRNRARDNSTGFRLDGPRPRLSGNTATDNGFDGYAINSTRGTLDADVASGNGRNGFNVGGDGNEARDLVARGNVDIGVLIFGSLNEVRSATAIGNGSHGVEVNVGTSHVLSRTTANRNGFQNGQSDGAGLGIRVLPAVVDLVARRNRAAGNDDPAQCSAAANCN